MCQCDANASPEWAIVFLRLSRPTEIGRESVRMSFGLPGSSGINVSYHFSRTDPDVFVCVRESVLPGSSGINVSYHFSRKDPDVFVCD